MVINPAMESTADTVSDLLGVPVLKLLIIRSCGSTSGERATFHLIDVCEEEDGILEVFASPETTNAVQITHRGRMTCELLRRLLTWKPDWVHYVGHGTEDYIRLFDAILAPQELATMLHRVGVHGVILNCCFSSNKVSEVAALVNTVVAVEGRLLHDSGCLFARLFWRGISEGHSVARSFLKAKDEAEKHFDKAKTEQAKAEQQSNAANAEQPEEADRFSYVLFQNGAQF
eukprot:m.514646 g.514646  ORF g.514646 m.514646 type:complete len:230 (+) comp113844_c0_seq1:1485-2174(+)